MLDLFKKYVLMIARYFAVFLPITTLIVLPIFYFGDALGVFLIETFGDAVGLFIRPLVIASLPILVFSLLQLRTLNTFNELVWFKQLTIKQIHFIYMSYIYSLGSFFIITLLIILMTLFVSHTDGINWYSAKDYIFKYLLLILVITPIFHVLKRKS